VRARVTRQHYVRAMRVYIRYIITTLWLAYQRSALYISYHHQNLRRKAYQRPYIEEEKLLRNSAYENTQHKRKSARCKPFSYQSLIAKKKQA